MTCTSEEFIWKQKTGVGGPSLYIRVWEYGIDNVKRLRDLSDVTSALFNVYTTSQTPYKSIAAVVHDVDGILRVDFLSTDFPAKIKGRANVIMTLSSGGPQTVPQDGFIRFIVEEF